MFFKEKIETTKHLKSLCTRIQVEIGHPTMRIRSDRWREFDNVDVDLFYDLKGIKHENSPFRTPQHNEVVERKKTKFFKKMAKVCYTYTVLGWSY